MALRSEYLQATKKRRVVIWNLLPYTDPRSDEIETSNLVLPNQFLIIPLLGLNSIVIQEAEKRSLISPHAIPKWKIFEGTSGSTGISLALVARALGYEAGKNQKKG